MKKTNFLAQVTNALLLRIGKIFHNLRDVYYANKNKQKAKILIFTDSRGYEVTKAWNRKSAYASYVGKLCKSYHVDYVICPEFSTTVIDFLYEYNQRIAQGKQYDAVIAHVGVVDFSPRPSSMLVDMMDNKSHKVASLFEEPQIALLKEYHSEVFTELYFGKTVKNFYSEAFLAEHILPKLSAISNLILIGCSPVLSDWRGNYWRDRPQNMNMILDYSARCKAEIEHFIDLSTLSNEEIMKFTIDNIHLSPAGFDYVLQLILAPLNSILSNKERK